MAFSVPKKYEDYRHQLSGRFVKQNLAKEFLENIEFSRDHPLFPNWKEWKEVVSKYYSRPTGICMDVLFDQSSILIDTREYEIDNAVHDAGCFSHAVHHWEKTPREQLPTMLSEVISNQRRFYPGDFDLRVSGVTFDCECLKRYFRGEQNGFPYNDCSYKRMHILNIYLSLILYLSKHQPRSMRKYYKKLARVFYVLPEKFLEEIDLETKFSVNDLLFNPRQVVIPGRNLLRQVYERGIFDKLLGKDFNNIPLWFEANKHFRQNPVQQGSSACQSVSATLFDDLAELVAAWHPKQQGFGNLYLKHELKISDEQFTKFEETVERTHANFMQALRHTLLDSAKDMMVLFIFVATIAFLGYTVAKFGLDIIISTLNLLYEITIGKFFEKKQYKIVQQDGGLSIPLLPAIVVDKIIAPPADILTTVWNSPQTDRVMRRIGYLGDQKISRGVDRITEWLENIIHLTMNWYKVNFLGLAPTEDIDTECSPVVRWYKDTDEFFLMYYKGEMQWNDMNWSILMNLYGRGMALIRQNVYADFKQDIWKIVFKLGNLLEKFNSHGKSGNSIRNPPVSIYLAGGTGVGKSSVTYPLAAEILKGIFQREPSNVDLAKYWKNLIYMRCPEQEFWDGYENQLVTIFDDFGQLVDSTASPNLELFEIVRAANSFPYPLHMASLDQKANTTFTSKIIMCSSNLDRPKTASLNFEQALFRRFDVCVKVTNKVGYIKQPGVFDPNIYVFQLYDMSTQKLGDFITYKDLVYLAVTKYFERKGFVNTMDDYISSVLKDNPKQQGLGLILGNSVAYVKDTCKTGYESVKSNYNDFVGSVWGQQEYRYVAEIKEALKGLHKRLYEAQKHWEVFKREHEYMYKAIKFIGIVTLIFGVVKLYHSMTSSSNKDKGKFMSVEQFVKSGNKQEAYTNVNIKNPKVEAYTNVQVKNPKVEAYTCPHIKNPKVESYVIPKVQNPKVEAYVAAQIKNPKVECNCISQINPIEEGIKDVSASEMMAKLIRRNFYKIYTSDSNEAIGHCIFLRGQIVMCPRHYVSAFKKIARNPGSHCVYFKNVFVQRSFEVDVNEILESAYYYESPEELNSPVFSKDIMAFPVKTATFHGNIIPFFADKNSVSFVKSSDVMLPVLLTNNMKDSDRPCVVFRFSKGHSALAVRDVTTIDNELGQPARIIRNLWEYSMDTQASECGAPLIVRNVNITPGKIVGIHVAGHDDGKGYSTPVYKTDVEKIIAQFNKYDSIEFRIKQNYGEYPTQQCQIPEDAEFIRIGTVDRPVAQPTKSKIIPSPLFNKIKDVETRPCLLRQAEINGEIFDPRKYRLGRLGNIPQFIRNLEVDLAVDALVDDISQNIQNCDFGPNIKSKYTYEEAVVGIDGEEFINSIKRNTSPGYPFVHMKGFETRTQIFGNEDKCDVNNVKSKILQRQVENLIELCKQGIITEHIFMDTLKDERKPMHKFHKTRLFSAGPLDYLIACKMYFNGVVAVLQKSRNFNGISVGTNPHSIDWSVISNQLLSKSDKLVAGDFEGFDASQSQRLLMAAGKVLIKLSERFCGSSEEDCFVMWNMLISLFNSVHISGNEVYQWTHSLPSGHYLTAIINSIFVLLSFCIVYQINYKRKNNRDANYLIARQFYKKCGKVAYGDDHIISIPSSDSDFNQLTLPELFAQIGLSYTMEDKDAKAEQPFRSIEEISYLKRRFVFDQDFHMWLSPLSLTTILESPMWIHRCPDPIDQVKSQIDDSLRELSQHEKEVWEKWFPVFDGCSKRINHYTEFRHQEDVKALVLNF